MYRIVLAVTLALATVGTANAQDVTAEQAAVVEELRRAADAARGASAETRTALVDELRAAALAQSARQAVLSIDQTGVQPVTAAWLTSVTGDPVSYSIAGRLGQSGSTSGALPIEIVSAIRSDAHLKSMNVGSGSANVFRVVDGAAVSDDRSTFNAAFGFENLDEFHAWYGAQGEALHRAIDRAGAEDVRFNLSVVPARDPAD